MPAVLVLHGAARGAGRLCRGVLTAQRGSNVLPALVHAQVQSCCLFPARASAVATVCDAGVSSRWEK